MNNSLYITCGIFIAICIHMQLAKGETNSESNPAMDYSIVMIPSSSITSIVNTLNKATDIRTAMPIYMSGYYDVILNQLVEQEATYEKKDTNGIWYNLGMEDAINLLKTYNSEEIYDDFLARLGFHKQQITGVFVDDQKLYMHDKNREFVRLYANKNISHTFNDTDSNKNSVRVITLEGWVGPKSNYIYPPIVGITFSYVMIVTKVISE